MMEWSIRLGAVISTFTPATASRQKFRTRSPQRPQSEMSPTKKGCDREGWPRAATRKSAARGIGGRFGRLVDGSRYDLRPAGGGAFLRGGKIYTSGYCDVWAFPERGFDRSRLIDAHEGAITRSEQKLRLDQCTEQCVTRCRIESPQASRLRLSESQSRHFKVLTLYAPKHFVVRWKSLRHQNPPIA